MVLENINRFVFFLFTHASEGLKYGVFYANNDSQLYKIKIIFPDLLRNK